VAEGATKIAPEGEEGAGHFVGKIQKCELLQTFDEHGRLLDENFGIALVLLRKVCYNKPKGRAFLHYIKKNGEMQPLLEGKLRKTENRETTHKGEKIMRTIISTTAAPAAIGPYSQAIRCGNMLYTSGQIPLDPATGAVVGDDIREQAEQVMKNLAAVLTAGGSSFANAVKTTCFLADMADFAAFNEVYAAYFTTGPARSCVAVKSLPKGVLVEVEVIALSE